MAEGGHMAAVSNGKFQLLLLIVLDVLDGCGGFLQVLINQKFQGVVLWNCAKKSNIVSTSESQY